MPPLSAVRRLPAELRDQVNVMLADGVTVTEIADKLRELGADVSRSSVGRYRLQWQDTMGRLAEVREFAEATIRNLADAPESKISRVNIELLQGALFSALTRMDAANMKPEDAVKLLVKASMAQQMISRAGRDEADTIIKASGFAEAKQGDLLVKQGDKLVRVEIVEPLSPVGDALPLPTETASGTATE